MVRLKFLIELDYWFETGLLSAKTFFISTLKGVGKRWYDCSDDRGRSSKRSQLKEFT